MVAVVHCNFALPADTGCNTVAAIAVVADTQLVVLDPMVSVAVVVVLVVVMRVEVVADLEVVAAEVHRNYFLVAEVLDKNYFTDLCKTILKSTDFNPSCMFRRNVEMLYLNDFCLAYEIICGILTKLFPSP